jgi:raffinose/stachyose/melibiose transport system permease protein
MIAAMKTDDLIDILTAGGPGGATETISFRIWKVGFTNLDMGRASATSILLLLVILAITVLLIRVIQPEDDEPIPTPTRRRSLR